ncbi:MAG: VOC family protein [Qingshengfaniella sp.]
MSDTLRVGHLRGLVMRAPDMTATAEFYTQQWGLHVAASADGIVYLRGSGPEPFIYGIKDGDTYGVEYVHFGMETRADMDALFAQVTGHGVTVYHPLGQFDDPIGGYGFEILDPDNRRLRFTCDLAMREDEQVYAYPRKVSHVVLNTPDMEGLETWYSEALGFRVSDYSADQMVFLRCSSDHHSIALVRAKYPAVNHVAFEMPGIDSFMRGIGRMKQQGQVPSWGPGRHGPGNNPFAYFVSPSGYVIEFTTEVQQIDEASHEVQVWSRTNPDSMDQWMTAGPPTTAQRTVMAGRPDPGFKVKNGA